MDIVRLALDLKPEHVLLYGVGPIGLLCAHLLRTAGVPRVEFVDPGVRACRRTLAEGFGAVASSNRLGADVAIATVPYHALGGCVAHVRTGGAVVYNGIGGGASGPSLRDFHTSRITLIPSFPHPQEGFGGAIEYTARYADELQSLLFPIIQFRDLPDAARVLTDRRTEMAKPVVVFPEETSSVQ